MTPCPLCDVTTGRDLYGLPEGFGLRRCSGCRFVYMAPRPTSDYLAAHYAAAEVYGYGTAQASDYDGVIADRRALISGFLKRFPSLPQAGRAVDFGAGAGATVKAMKDMGFDAMGAEISTKAREAAKALFDVDMRAMDIGDFPDQDIALLTMFDVLEHMLDPKAFLKTAFQKLKPGAGFLIGVPNFDSLDRMMRGTASPTLYFPDHVNQFTRSSLEALCRDVGFEVLYVGSPPPYGVAITLGLRAALRRTFGKGAIVQAMCRALVTIKRHVIYPLPNLFVEKTGVWAQSVLLLASKQG